jgi:sugar phosphate isomerase/epimerase
MTILTEPLARRNFFLQSAALATATVISPQLARTSADAPRAIGLGFSLYGMKSLGLLPALKVVAEIGYDCVELPVMPDWPADSASFTALARKDFRDELARRKLRLTALMENLPALGDDTQHRAHLERLRRAAELARNFAADAPPSTPSLIETILGGKAGDFDAVKHRLAERLSDYAKAVAEAGVLLAVKAHIGNATQRPEQLAWLLDQVASPSLKAAYDYSHFELQDLPLKQTTDALLPQTAFIHVKDTERAQAKRNFLLPGEGPTDYVALLKLIAASPYRGDVVVEVSSQISNRPAYDPIAAARQCYNHLADAFAKAGVSRRSQSAN